MAKKIKNEFKKANPLSPRGRKKEPVPTAEELENLLRQFVELPAGRRALEFALEKKITIALSPDLPTNIFGMFEENSIVLNSKLKNEALIPGLFHELRHVIQAYKGLDPHIEQTEAGLVRRPLRSPRYNFLIWRLQEADALAHQMEYAYEYTKKTGNALPAKILEDNMGGLYAAYWDAREAKGGNPDAAKRAVFRHFIEHETDFYDDYSLRMFDRLLQTYRQLGKKYIFNQTAMTKPQLTASVMRKFGETTDADGNPRNYLEGIPDKELLSEKWFGTVTSKVNEALEKLEKRYDRFYKPFSRPAKGAHSLS